MCYAEIVVRTGNRTFRARLDENVCRVLEEVYPDDPAAAAASIISDHAAQLERLGRWVRKIIREAVDKK